MITHKSQQGDGPIFELDYDPATHTVREVFDPETEELTGLEPVPLLPKSADELAALRKQIKAEIADAADRYVNHEANAPLQDELRLAALPAPLRSVAGLPEPPPMILAILAWGREVFRDAEIRKAEVDAGLCDDGDYLTMLDFTMHGEKPHTVAALWQAGLIEL